MSVGGDKGGPAPEPLPGERATPGDAIIPYGRQDVTDADVAAVGAALRGPWLTQGPTVERFEDALRELTGAPHAVAVSSGTAALHLAYLGLGLGPGDRGLCPAVSFVATANGLLYTGAEAGFADVEPDTGLVEAGALRAMAQRWADEGRPARVVTGVDLTGQPVDRVLLRAAAGAQGFVVEDAAHALGGRYAVDGREHPVGSCHHADAAILSFHPVKHATTGEGGAVLTADATLARRVRELRSHGIHRDPARFVGRPGAAAASATPAAPAPDDPFVGPWSYEQDALGFNYRITDLQCALGLSQLTRLEGYLARRRALAEAYDAALAPLSGWLRPLRRPPGGRHAFHLYVVQLVPRPGEPDAEVAARRKALFLGLRARGIHAQVHYAPIPWQPFHAGRPCHPEGVPGAVAYYARSLSLPLFPALTEAEHARVVAALFALREP